jgi:hypothetical protein
MPPLIFFAGRLSVRGGAPRCASLRSDGTKISDSKEEV